MIIGITGGIGSGKTYVSNLFEQEGIPIYNADCRAKIIINSSIQIREKIIEEFGEESYCETSLNAKYISSIVFDNAEKLEKLNAITHPVIKEHFIDWAKQELKTNKIVGIESAILFQSGFDTAVDKVICITADVETRINRVIARDNSSREEIEKRINSQEDTERLLKKADFIIDTNENNLILSQINSILRQL